MMLKPPYRYQYGRFSPVQTAVDQDEGGPNPGPGAIAEAGLEMIMAM